MKRNRLKPLVTGLCLLALSGCSWISNRRTLFDDEEKKGADKPASMVSKEQYDQLQSKYEKAMQEIRMLKSAQAPSDADQLANAFEKKSADPSILVDELSKVQDKAPELAETVDVFGKQGLVSKGSAASALTTVSGSRIENEIKKLRLAEALLNENKFDAALAHIKELESSPIRQVRVRAKFLLGEMLFRQEEYDLAMQIYEEILEKEAFSGVVIKTLGRLIVCSEKLKIDKKKERYYSILHDFFES